MKIIFNPSLESIPMYCEATWDLIGSGNTKGVFQLESRLGQMLAKKLKPRNIDHLSALVAIMRPGCIAKGTQIIHKVYNRANGGRNYKRVNIEELYANQDKYDTIISVDEDTGEFFENKVNKVFYNGVKEIYRIGTRKNLRCDRGDDYYNLRCTIDHKLLTPDGWKELGELKQGDRFAVLKRNGKERVSDGSKYFREVCFQNYEYHCVFCDWKQGSLDVNHLEGDRHTNNEADNLCFMCPNHHRLYTEHKITPEEARKAREKYFLPQYPDIKWVELVDYEVVDETDVYDISVEGPNHNFIAGNVVVHNCLEAMRDGKSVTQHYIDRKNDEEAVTYFHPSLEPSLRSTFGEMIYQEQAMQIARDLAGFSLQEADVLRKAIGKKKADMMNKVEHTFMEGCKFTGVVPNDVAKEIFEWIRKSQRYSFNKSHSVSYAYNAYLSAYTKAHFRRAFFTSYLYYAKEKIKPHDEVRELVNNARTMDVDVYPPDLRKQNAHFALFDRKVFFGLVDIKGVGESAITRMTKKIVQAEEELGRPIEDWCWSDFLLFLSQNISKTAVEAMIKVGALRWMNVSRQRMWFEFEQFSAVSDREQKWLKEKYIDDSQSDISCSELLQILLDSPVGRKGGISNKNRYKKVVGIKAIVDKPPSSLEDTPEWIASVEESLMGISITCTVVDSCETSAANTTCKDFNSGTSRKNGIMMAVKVDEVKEITTKKGKNPGQKMAFLSVSDSYGALDSCVLFPDEWTQSRVKLFIGNTVMLGGERGKEKDSFIVNKVWQI